MSMREPVTSMILGISWVARGYTAARFTLRVSMLRMYSAMCLSASSSGEVPSSWDLWMILSSTSVKFWTCCTSWPRYSR